MPDAKPVWRVVETIPENHDVTSVVIEAPEGTPPSHRPGQFASIRVMTDGGWSEPHPFTISCDAHDNRLRFTIKSIGDFTSSIRDWKPGTPVQCSGPMGAFCKDIASQENIVMIAGGVGITPFLSVLRTFRTDGAANAILLFWSNKTVEDAFARSELEDLTRHLNLRVMLLFTRCEELPEAPPGGRVFFRAGRLDKAMLEEFGVSPTASFYVCGPPAMQEAVVGMLQSCGIARERVQREAFGLKGK
jgi:predicted ferric reductase